MSPTRLLILEDDAATSWVIQRLAEKEGYQVQTQASIRGAHALIQNFKPDILFLDLKLSGGDGVEILSRLDDDGSQLPIVIMSGFDYKILSSTGRMARELGLNIVATLQKPVQVGQITELLQQQKTGTLPSNTHAQRIPPESMYAELACAIEVGNIQPYFQPKIDLRSGRMIGVEVLARWLHPQRGLLMPMAFIRHAEDHGMIRRLTRSILEQSLHHAQQWQQQGYQLDLAINISALLLNNKFFPDDLEMALLRYRFPEERLILEVTETVAMENPSMTTEVLNRLRLRKVRLSLDDFGTGYSSLVELHRMPFTELKVDVQFVRDLLRDPDSCIIVDAMIQLGHKLRMKVVVEGVESVNLLNKVRELGADTAQGFYFSPALPAPELINWCQQHHEQLIWEPLKEAQAQD